ncbi:hypothetical protein DFP83_11113 [Idiomarina fontislapidosi]|nr:hypothetical protein DFP83_11113 [Idiomarina fontislapidosi]
MHKSLVSSKGFNEHLLFISFPDNLITKLTFETVSQYDAAIAMHLSVS